MRATAPRAAGGVGASAPAGVTAMDAPTLAATIAALLVSLAGGGLLAAVLARKGKSEDVKLAKTAQAFDQMRDLAEERGQEVKDLRAEKLAERAEHERIRERERAEHERRVAALEGRLDRQYSRCRRITEAFVRAIAAKSPAAGEDAEHLAQEHFFDHDWGVGDSPSTEGGRGERT